MRVPSFAGSPALSEAKPGRREQLLLCMHFEQPCRSLTLIERTSRNCGECCQMSTNFVMRTLPLGGGNCMHG